MNGLHFSWKIDNMYESTFKIPGGTSLPKPNLSTPSQERKIPQCYVSCCQLRNQNSNCCHHMCNVCYGLTLCQRKKIQFVPEKLILKKYQQMWCYIKMCFKQSSVIYIWSCHIAFNVGIITKKNIEFDKKMF